MAHFSKLYEFAYDLSVASPQPMASPSLRRSEKGRLPFKSQPTPCRWIADAVFPKPFVWLGETGCSVRCASRVLVYTPRGAGTASRTSRVCGTSGPARSRVTDQAIPVAAPLYLCWRA